MTSDRRNFETEEEKQGHEGRLLENIKKNYESLNDLLERCSDYQYRDPVYRFYHQSFKVYYLQEVTLEIVHALAALMPERPMNKWFMEIIQQGTGKTFVDAHNLAWTENTRGILEAFFHARFMLEMACKYGKELEKPSNVIPSGWGAVLYLFYLR